MVTSKRGTLSREVICQAAITLIEAKGVNAFSLRAVAKSLGVDPAAIYRHYADVDDLMREVSDLALAPTVRDFRCTDDPRADVRLLMTRLRDVLLVNGVARLSALGPTRYPNELFITETMLDAALRCGLADEQAVLAYHVLVEYTVGSATLDAPLSQDPHTRAQTYDIWRGDYAELAAADYPVIAQLRGLLYPGSDVVFEAGLDALIAQFLH